MIGLIWQGQLIDSLQDEEGVFPPSSTDDQVLFWGSWSASL